MATLQTYSPEDVIILVAGFLKIEGLMDGSFVSIVANSPIATAERTADGKVARLVNKDDTYTVAITLTSTSESNDVLTKLALVDRLTAKGILPILIKDTRGSSLFFSPSAWIEVMPNQEFTDDISSRTWIFRCTQGVQNIGSNTESSGLLEDLFNTVANSAPAFLDII